MNAGTICAAFGAAFLAASLQFDVGSARQMGPGYVPAVLGALLLELGLLQLAHRDPVRQTMHLRPAVFVLGGLAAFAATLEALGLVGATLLLVAIAGVVAQERRWMDVAVTAAALALFSALVFVRLLGLPIPMWPRGW